MKVDKEQELAIKNKVASINTILCFESSSSGLWLQLISVKKFYGKAELATECFEQ
jgi:hypothetical protein